MEDSPQDFQAQDPEISTGTEVDFNKLTLNERRLMLIAHAATARVGLENLSVSGEASDEEIVAAKERKAAADQRLHEFRVQHDMPSTPPENEV